MATIVAIQGFCGIFEPYPQDNPLARGSQIPQNPWTRGTIPLTKLPGRGSLRP